MNDTPRNILCTVCARGGSTGVLDKNHRPILGKPLIAHTIEQAIASQCFSHIAVSSDDERILDAASKAGADILVVRPAHLASDTAAKPPAIRHCADEAARQTGMDYSIFVDLDATAPLRIPSDIMGAIDLLVQTGCSNVITGAPAHRSPYFNLVEVTGDGFVEISKSLKRDVFRRQDSPKCFDMNASIYVWTRVAFLEGPAVLRPDTRLFEMPAERSLDIDSELDFELVSFLLEKRRAMGGDT